MIILAEISGFGDIFTNVLLVEHVVICLILCLTVLMQRPKQEGLGAAFGGGMTDQAFGARTTDVLQKGTVYLASGLFIVTLILSILVGSASTDSKISKDIEEKKEAAVEEHGDAAVAAAADLTEGEISQDQLSAKVEEAATSSSDSDPEVSEPAEASDNQ